MKNNYEQKMRLLQLKSSMIASVVGFYASSNAALAMNPNLTGKQFAEQLKANREQENNLIEKIKRGDSKTTFNIIQEL